MRLTPEQQRVVEENMGLVVKVIQDKVHDLNQDSCFSFEDLRQIGAIGLCKAAATDKGGCFSTGLHQKILKNQIIEAAIVGFGITEELPEGSEDTALEAVLGGVDPAPDISLFH